MFWLLVKGLKGLFGFLTIVPLGMESIEAISKYFFLCPIVGLAIGLIAGAIGFASNILLPDSISGFLDAFKGPEGVLRVCYGTGDLVGSEFYAAAVGGHKGNAGDPFSHENEIVFTPGFILFQFGKTAVSIQRHSSRIKVHEFKSGAIKQSLVAQLDFRNDQKGHEGKRHERRMQFGPHLFRHIVKPGILGGDRLEAFIAHESRNGQGQDFPKVF